MLIVHETSSKYIESILKQNALTPYKKNKNTGYGEDDDIMNTNVVYLTVLFKDYLFYFPKNDTKVFLFFDDKLLKKKEPLLFCATWSFGKLDENYCITYNKKLTVNQNYKSWEKLYKFKNPFEKNIQKYIYGPNLSSPLANEIIIEDDISLDNLVGIYCHNAKWKHPLLMTKSQEVELFLNDYGYNEVDTVSLNKSYVIKYDIDMTEEEHDKEEERWLKNMKKKNYKTKTWNNWKNKN
jgi:hypothetical protein